MKKNYSRFWPHPRALPEPDDPAGWGQFSEDTTTRLTPLRRSGRIAHKSERAPLRQSGRTAQKSEGAPLRRSGRTAQKSERAASTLKSTRMSLQVPEIPASVDDTTRSVSPERSGQKRPYSPEPSCSYDPEAKIPRLEYYDLSSDSESGCPSPVSPNKESRGPIWPIFKAYFGKKEKLKKKRGIKEPPKSDYNVPQYPTVDDIIRWQREEAAVTGSQIPDIETEREPDSVQEPVAEPDLGPEPVVAEPDPERMIQPSTNKRKRRSSEENDEDEPPKKRRKIDIQQPSPSSSSSSSTPHPTPPPVIDTGGDQASAGPMRRSRFATKRMLRLLQDNGRVNIVDGYNLRPDRPAANFYKKFYYIRKYN